MATRAKPGLATDGGRRAGGSAPWGHRRRRADKGFASCQRDDNSVRGVDARGSRPHGCLRSSLVAPWYAFCTPLRRYFNAARANAVPIAPIPPRRRVAASSTEAVRCPSDRALAIVIGEDRPCPSTARSVRRRGGRRSVNAVALLGLVLGTGLVATAFQDQRRSGEGAETLEERGDRFGRMFLLPPFALPTPPVTKALETLGQRGGLMDAADQLSAGPLQLIVDPALNTEQPQQRQPHRWHDVHGPVPGPRHDVRHHVAARSPGDPGLAPNGRHPYFDLDSVYGDGPRDHPALQRGRPRQVHRGEWRAVRGPAARRVDASDIATRATTKR